MKCFLGNNTMNKVIKKIFCKVMCRLINIENAIKIFVKKINLEIDSNIIIDKTARIFPETMINSLNLGEIIIGKRSCIRGSLEIQRKNGKIQVGDNVYIGDGTRIWAADCIEIGNNVLIAHNCNIFDNDTHPIDYTERREDADCIIWKGERRDFVSLKAQKIEIKDDVWIGANCSVMKGVSIGKRTIVAANSVVTKSFPDDVVVAGNPAKIVKKIGER